MPATEEQRPLSHVMSWSRSPSSIWSEALLEQLSCPLPSRERPFEARGKIGVGKSVILPPHIERILQQIVLAGQFPEVKSSFGEDVRYYRQNLSRFLDKYEGKYVAIINKKVVDDDNDFSELAKRVFQKYGCRDIFMPKVTEKERVVHIPTPFLERSSSGSI